MKPLSVVLTRLAPATLAQALLGFIGLVCLSLILATLWQVNQSRQERIATAKIAVSLRRRQHLQQARAHTQSREGVPVDRCSPSLSTFLCNDNGSNPASTSRSVVLT